MAEKAALQTVSCTTVMRKPCENVRKASLRVKLELQDECLAGTSDVHNAVRSANLKVRSGQAVSAGYIRPVGSMCSGMIPHLHESVCF